MTSKPALNVQSFPRPPLLEKVDRHIRIVWNGELIADTTDAFWVLETHHPPTYYLPPACVRVPLVRTRRVTHCEWKGAATYYSASSPRPDSDTEEAGSPLRAVATAVDRIWSYEDPAPAFRPIQGYVSFYAGPWDCYVDGEKVEPQPGDFYGGWVTSEVEGVVKGRRGNLDPI